MIKTISSYITNFLYERCVIKEKEFSICVYGFEILLSGISTLLVVIFTSIVLKKILEMMIFLIFFVILRRCTGGYHAKNYFACCILTNVSSIGAIYIGDFLFQWNRYILIVLLGISATVVWFLAPIVNKNKPVKENELPRYRNLARAICIGYGMIIIVSTVLNNYLFMIFPTMAIFVTAITLITGKIEKLEKGGN